MDFEFAKYQLRLGSQHINMRKLVIHILELLHIDEQGTDFGLLDFNTIYNACQTNCHSSIL